MMKDLLKIPQAGDPISAAQQALIVEILRGVTNGPDCFIDSAGVHFRPRKTAGFNAHWGALDDDLDHDDSDGVSVTLDVGGTAEGVLYPPGWPAGTLLEDARVLVAKVDGEWYVILSPCVAAEE